MGYRYPIDVCDSKNRTQTLSVESHLSRAETRNSQPPLRIFDERFSLYKFTIIEKESENKTVKANLKENELADLVKRTDYAFNKSMENELSGGDSTEGLSLAYTVKMPTGPFAGKTPAEALLEDPGNAEGLNGHFQWLRKMCNDPEKAKYKEGNKRQMHAIQDAASLQKEGRLDRKAAASSAKRVRLYPASATTAPKPLREQKENGKRFVYEMEIYWHIGNDYPVEIRIKNYYATVETKEDGTIRVLSSTAEDVVSKAARVSESEWMDHLQKMKVDRDMFAVLNAKATREDAMATLEANKRESAAKAG